MMLLGGEVILVGFEIDFLESLLFVCFVKWFDCNIIFLNVIKKLDLIIEKSKSI